VIAARAVAKPAEQARYERIVQVAETMLVQLGEQGFQMKQLAERSEVALATLYRYFPSKDHVLGAIALARIARAVSLEPVRRYSGRTAGERTAEQLVRLFDASQREPEIWSSLQRVMMAPDRSMSQVVERLYSAFEEMILLAISFHGDPPTAEQRMLVPMVISARNGATANWLVGFVSSEQARTQIRVAAHLLDLPAEQIRQVLSAAGVV